MESEVGRARGEAMALYQIIRRLSGRFERTCKPVNDEAGGRSGKRRSRRRTRR